MIDFMQTDILEHLSADNKLKVFQYMMDNINFRTEPPTPEQIMLTIKLREKIRQAK